MLVDKKQVLECFFAKDGWLRDHLSIVQDICNLPSIPEQKAAGDLISRQEAIKAIEDLPNCCNGYSDTYDKAQIIGMIEELPSAEHHKLNIAEYIHDFYPDVWRHAEKELEVQPSAQQKGKWISHSIGHKNTPCGYDCSACGKWFIIDNYTAEEYNYCPNCGADMRGENE